MKYLKIGEKFIFDLQNNSQIDIHILTKIISIDHKTSADWIYAYANKKDFNEFLKLNFKL